TKTHTSRSAVRVTIFSNTALVSSSGKTLCHTTGCDNNSRRVAESCIRGFVLFMNPLSFLSHFRMVSLACEYIPLVSFNCDRFSRHAQQGNGSVEQFELHFAFHVLHIRNSKTPRGICQAIGGAASSG